MWCASGRSVAPTLGGAGEKLATGARNGSGPQRRFGGRGGRRRQLIQIEQDAKIVRHHVFSVAWAVGERTKNHNACAHANEGDMVSTICRRLGQPDRGRARACHGPVR